MLRINLQANIGDFSFLSISELVIQSSYRSLIDTAQVKLPTNLKQKSLDIIQEINQGDAVEIFIGYYPWLPLRFSGFVSQVIPDNPLIIQCEDLGWQLKQQSVDNFFAKSTTLNNLIDTIVDVDFETATTNLGTFRIKGNPTVMEVLQKLKEQYSLFSYIRDESLKVGLSKEASFTSNRKKFYFNDPLRANITRSSLSYEKKENLKIVVKGTSIDSNNNRITRYANYDKNGNIVVSSTQAVGELRTLNFLNLSQTELDDELRNKLPQIHYEGYRGSFESFLHPAVRHGDEAEIIDYKFPERDGVYQIREVITTFSTQIGGRQEIFLDNKIS